MTINEKENTRISKFLSYVLRHKPEEIGLTLDENGWADVNSLIDQANKAGIPLTFEILEHIVDTNSKRRFSFNDKQDKIRANQGHSIEIDLALKPTEPPGILYHGTAEKFVASILITGLLKQDRHHVHLSSTIETAKKVGQRRGKAFVFEVLAAEMYKNNFEFFLSENGVWLTDCVPVKYLREIKLG